MPHAVNSNHKKPSAVRWRLWWCALAALAAIPAVYCANRELLQTRLELDTRLIVEQRLWESDPGYAGTAQNWTRFAAWLLSSEQLLERMRVLQPAHAESIEEEYRRDATLALGAVLLRYLAIWGVPIGVAYGVAVLFERRRVKPSA